MEIKVRKETDRQLMLDACEMTFAGRSNQTLKGMYSVEHSPARTQLFWVTCEDIPLYVSTHLLRHHVGAQPFALTHRTDRKGGGLDLTELVGRIQDLRVEEAEDSDLDNSKEIDEILETIKTKGGRMTPTNLGILINAQSLIDMAKLRLCLHASEHTREVFQVIKDKVAEVDPELSELMVRKCVYRGGLCGESCGFNQTIMFDVEMTQYLKNFTEKQAGAWLTSN